MVRGLPDDGNRYETVHGELLITAPPPPSHEVVVSRIAAHLSEYIEGNAAGIVLTSPADISWSPDVLVQPDVFVVPLDEARTLQWSRIRSLLLAVEVVSRVTSRRDRFTKRRLYQEVGVPLYWILDPDRRMIEIWRPEDTVPRLVWDGVSWHPAGVPRPLRLGLAELFDSTHPRRPATRDRDRRSA